MKARFTSTLSMLPRTSRRWRSDRESSQAWLASTGPMSKACRVNIRCGAARAIPAMVYMPTPDWPLSIKFVCRAGMTSAKLRGIRSAPTASAKWRDPRAFEARMETPATASGVSIGFFP